MVQRQGYKRFVIYYIILCHFTLYYVVRSIVLAQRGYIKLIGTRTNVVTNI